MSLWITIFSVILAWFGMPDSPIIMQKVKVPCWKETINCQTGDMTDLYFTFSDFYPARNLFICPTCGAIFTVDPATEHYQGKDFNEVKQTLNCPECSSSLSNLLPYPDNVRCPSIGQIEKSFRKAGEIPADRTEFIIECWDPLS
jgi:rubredoxin